MVTLDVARSILGVRPSNNKFDDFPTVRPRDFIYFPGADAEIVADGNVRRLELALTLLKRRDATAPRARLEQLQATAANRRPSALSDIAEAILLKEIEEEEGFVGGLARVA